MEMQIQSLQEVRPAPETPTESRALACVLEYAAGAFVALPIHSGVELVEKPRFVPVPGMPEHALGLMAWQGRQLPLIDLASYLRGEPAPAGEQMSHVLVTAYQTARGEPIEYGAVNAPFLVRMVEVGNSQACPLPAELLDRADATVSCFRYQDEPVAVLDLARIFTGQAIRSRPAR